MSNQTRPDCCKDEHLEYLDDLRDSGVTNMFGAAPYLGNAFNMNRADARSILKYWMTTYVERHPES